MSVSSFGILWDLESITHPKMSEFDLRGGGQPLSKTSEIQNSLIYLIGTGGLNKAS